MPKFVGMSVFLNVKDLETSAAFYDGLGFPRVLEFPEMGVIGYGLGDSTFLIGDATEPAPDVAQWLKAKEWGVGVVVMPTVESVDEIYDLALEAGAQIEEPPTDQPWGSRTLQLLDPDGYVLSFDQPMAPPPSRADRVRGAPRKGAKKAGAKRAVKAPAKKTTKRRAVKASPKKAAKKRAAKAAGKKARR